MVYGNGGPIVISQRALKWLVFGQSALSGLQVIAAASILGEVIGPKFAALAIVVVAGAQQFVNSALSKSVGESVSQVQNVVERADAVTQRASETVTALAAAMPPEPAMRALLEHQAEAQEGRDNPHGR